jgi:hypothetical protein
VEVQEVLVVAVGLLFGFMLRHVLSPFLSGYSDQKGKNLATHEDVRLLVQQVQMVTRTTEEIKADITGDLWTRQSHWNFKREAYSRLVETLAEKWSLLCQIEVQGALAGLQSRLEAADIALVRAGGTVALATGGQRSDLLQEVSSCMTAADVRGRIEGLLLAAKEDLRLA